MRLILNEVPLKRLLQLFEPEDLVQRLALGDTLHPASGFVDEAILGPVDRVRQILAVDYDFGGLVQFAAHINDVNVVYIQDTVELTGTKQSIGKLISKLKMRNAQPDGPPAYLIRLID